MSHTDRHRPWWVQQKDPLELGYYWFQTWPRFDPVKVPTYSLCSCRWHSGWWPARIAKRGRRRFEREAAARVLGGDLDAYDTHR